MRWNPHLYPLFGQQVLVRQTIDPRREPTIIVLLYEHGIATTHDLSLYPEIKVDESISEPSTEPLLFAVDKFQCRDSPTAWGTENKRQQNAQL